VFWLNIIGIIITIPAQAVAYHSIIDAIRTARRNKHLHHIHNEWNLILFALNATPGSVIGLYSALYGTTCMIYHIIRAAVGEGSELFEYWPTTFIMMLVMTPFWTGVAHFAWVLVKHTTSAMTMANGAGAGAAAASLKRFKFALIMGAAIGCIGTYTSCIWTRLSGASMNGQSNAMSMFFLTVTVSGMIHLLISFCFRNY
jgi:hypothetical protein